MTNNDGRASAFLTWEQFEVGRYKMHFQLEQYFNKKGVHSFYPYAEVTPFKILWLSDYALTQCFPKSGPRTIYGPRDFPNWSVRKKGTIFIFIIYSMWSKIHPIWMKLSSKLITPSQIQLNQYKTPPLGPPKVTLGCTHWDFSVLDGPRNYF